MNSNILSANVHLYEFEFALQKTLTIVNYFFCKQNRKRGTIVNYFSVGVKSKMVTIFYCLVVFISLLLIFWWLCINCPFCSDIAIDDLKSENKISLFNLIYLCWNIIYCYIVSSSDYSTQFSTVKYYLRKLKGEGKSAVKSPPCFIFYMLTVTGILF